MDVMRVGVVGAYGKMGIAICDALEASTEHTLSARIGSNDELRLLAEAGTDVVVDVTNLEAARANLPWFAMHDMHAVVGTTGFSADDLSQLQRVYLTNNKACFLVPNFSIGAVLMMKFAEQAAPYFDTVEIIELHHEKKKDAPSGTAALTAKRIAAARTTPWAPDPTETETVKGSRGGEIEPGVRVHSVRMAGLLAHQEVLFGAAGQTLTIRHDSLDRVSFMPGVLRAVESVGSLPAGITSGLDAVL
jgi:4-hydroxy-tetrahydrodipicolinate reductase